MDYATTTTLTNAYLNIDTDMATKDPIRALKKGSLVRLNLSELIELYWKPTAGTMVFVPYSSDLNSMEHKIRVTALPKPKNITFLILEDLDNLNTVHGWLSVAYSDDKIDMAKGWFNYDMLVRCIDFSEADDS